MDRLQRLLTAVLAAQLVLLAIVYHPFSRAKAGGGERLLPALASVTPDRIEIAGSEGSPLTLKRRSGAWTLGTPAGYPVEPGKVEKVIQDLEHLAAVRPVASGRGSHAALKVAADQFERRVRVWAGAKATSPAAELYLGSSPGAGVSHVRVGGSDRVFEASGLTAYDVPADAGSWIERRLVPYRGEDVIRLAITNRKGSFTLEGGPGGWHVAAGSGRASTPAGALLDSTKVSELARALCDLSIEQPVGPVDERAQGLADPEATIILGRSATPAGKAAAASSPPEVTVRIGAPVPGRADARYATRSGLEFAVTVEKYGFDRPLGVELKELLRH